ncbi:MAG: hypothetical protein ACRD3T_14395 [Terriglobia bacterium]
MWRAVLAIWALSLSSAVGFAATHTQVIQFAPGDSLQFRLRGGDVHIIKGSDPQHIVVRYTPDSKRQDDDQKVQLRTRIAGSRVEVEIKAPPSLGVDTEIEVPSPVSLRVHLTGGDLTIEGVEGNKDLRVFAGDIKVDVGPSSSLRRAVASTRIGDVDAPEGGEIHGWLGHTWKYEGKGQYSLYAHVSFGDVELNTK